MLQYCLFYLLGFCLQGTCNLSSPTRDRTCVPCIGRQRTARKLQIILFLIPCKLYHYCVSWDVLYILALRGAMDSSGPESRFCPLCGLPLKGQEKSQSSLAQSMQRRAGPSLYTQFQLLIPLANWITSLLIASEPLTVAKFCHLLALWIWVGNSGFLDSSNSLFSYFIQEDNWSVKLLNVFLSRCTQQIQWRESHEGASPSLKETAFLQESRVFVYEIFNNLREKDGRENPRSPRRGE